MFYLFRDTKEGHKVPMKNFSHIFLSLMSPPNIKHFRGWDLCYCYATHTTDILHNSDESIIQNDHLPSSNT